MNSRGIGIVLGLAVLVLPASVRATVPGDLCVGNPCVISADADIDDGSALSFGATTDVIIEEDVTLTVLGTEPDVQFDAKSIVLEAGAEIRGAAGRTQGLDLILYTYAGDLELRVDGTKRARLDVSGPDAGAAYFTATGGSILFDGIVDGRTAFPPQPIYEADVDIRLADSLFNGTVRGGFTQIDAGGDVEIVGHVTTAGPQEGGDLSIEAGGGVTIRPGGTLEASSSAPGAPSGSIFVSAYGGDIEHEGQVVGTSASAALTTQASTIQMYSSVGSVVLTGTIDVSAGNNGESADNSEIVAPLGDIDQQPGATIDVSSKGPGGRSYGIAFLAGGNILLRDDVIANGGGNGGGTIEVAAGLQVLVEGELSAKASNGGDAGAIELSACDVEVSGKLSVDVGSTGTTVLEGGRQVVVTGQIKAGSSNDVRYDLNEPVLTGSISPPPAVAQTADSSGCAALAACGNGLLDVGEGCDDGNLVDGDCCDSSCAAESAGNACAVDWGPCALSQCDGLGACGVATPGAGCWMSVSPLRSQLTITDKDADKGDLVVFKWIKGEEVSVGALPDPVGSDDVDFCLYAPEGRPLFHASAPAGGSCAGKPCWIAKSTGYKYADKDRTPDGILMVLLKAGDAGKAKAQLKGKGENLPDLPELPMSLPARAELKASNGACWEATFDAGGVLRNDVNGFKAKATS